VLFEFITRAAQSLEFVSCGAYRSDPTVVVLVELILPKKLVVIYIFISQTSKILTSFYIYNFTAR
jgi:hypothetical protein